MKKQQSEPLRGEAAYRAHLRDVARSNEVAQAAAVRGFDDDLQAARDLSAVVTSETRGPVAWVARPTVDQPESKAQSESPDSPKTSGGGGAAGSYHGRNHVWIPALGINRSVSGFSCSSSAYPGNRVYRWGCAGRNNVYLFGHAHSVFKPLHDAYVRGRLKKGMKVYYADSSGKVSRYVVRWWRVTTPDNGEWAYAGQSTPSLTLQTCVGAKSQYRLIVRLTRG
jgi:sortase (surface protein transpeptidase)